MHLALLGDRRAVVIRRVDACATKVPPVCTTKRLSILEAVASLRINGRRAYHVHIEYGSTRGDVVLVEHSLELMVRELCALIKAISAPRLVSSTLEFGKLLGISEVHPTY